MTVPYRDAPLETRCTTCEQPATAPCTRCGLPTCAAHARPSTRCVPCDAAIDAAEGEVRIFHQPGVSVMLAGLAGYVGLVTVLVMPTFGLAALLTSTIAGAAGQLNLHRRIRRARAAAIQPRRARLPLPPPPATGQHAAVT